MDSTCENWITDWNNIGPPQAPRGEVLIHDETLRDGLQSPSVTQPTLDKKLELLHLMYKIGVVSADLGMPVSSSTSRMHVRRLAAEIADCRLPIAAACAARTTLADITAVAEIAQATGLPISVMAFVGISPVRMLAEQWSKDFVIATTREALTFARREGIEVCIVTEDTTRSRIRIALDVYAAALEAGAERICICDTVGYATPWGAAAVVNQISLGLAERGFPGVGIDWHGHNDRGLATANSLAAASAGADRLHGTALGIGERAGNAATEQLLVNLHAIGWRAGDLSLLTQYCELVAESCGVSTSVGQPFVGRDVFRTSAGVHAAAIRKAEHIGGRWLAERIYTGIPASTVGRTQVIDVGPGSGRANILCWLDAHGITPRPSLIQRMQDAIAGADQVLTDQQLLAIAGDSLSMIDMVGASIADIREPARG